MSMSRAAGYVGYWFGDGEREGAVKCAPISIRVDPDIVKFIDNLAQRTGETRSSICASLLKAAVGDVAEEMFKQDLITEEELV